MEKIQTEAILPIQAGFKTRKYTPGETGATFDSLLKEQSRTAEGSMQKSSISGNEPKRADQKSGKESAVSTETAKGTGKDKEVPEPDKKTDISGNDLLFPGMITVLSGTIDPLADVTGELGEISADMVGTAVEEISGEELFASVGPENVLQEMQGTEVSEALTAGQEAASQTIPAAQTDEVLAVSGEDMRPEENRPEPKPVISEMKAEKNEFPEERAAEADVKPEERVSGSEKPFEQQSGNNLAEGKKEEAVPVRTREVRTGEETRMESGTGMQFLRAADMQARNYSAVGTETGTSATVETTPSSLVDDVGETLAQKFPQSNGTLTIELEPASLGRLTIKVLYEDGKATVSILSTNPKTLELLTARASELASILEERTGQETLIYTQPSESERPFDERQGENRREGREPDEQERQKKDGQDSFAQQLRLGLI